MLQLGKFKVQGLKMRVLFIDEETDVRETLSSFFAKQNYKADDAGSLKDGSYLISVRNYDVILLSFKSSSGIREIIEAIRAKMPKTPIIVTNQKNAKVEQEIQAFEMGADDYILKPINPQALKARIEARLKFSNSKVIEVEDLIINPDEERVIYKGKEVEVKGKPFEVLTHLALHRDRIVSKEQLLDAIWQEPEMVTPNVIEVAINQIRQRLDKPLNISTVETVRRRGYRFCYPKNLN